MSTAAFTATPGVEVITTTADIPSLGSLAINAFVLHGPEPLLVDTGTVAGAAEFMTALASVIDPAKLRWIWLTHTDFDHIGSLATLLDTNRHLRVITSFLGVGIMGLSSTPLPMERVHLVNPGQSVTIGDRRLLAVKPPVFDNPITTGFIDDHTGVLFSSDCFGALLPAVPSTAADLDTDLLQAGQVRWATIDSAWIHAVDRSAFSRALDRLRAIEPTMVCSSHLPPAPGAMLDLFIDSLAQVPDAEPFIGPDQAALEAMVGAGIEFDDRGGHELKGVPGTWRLYAVATATS